LTRQVDYAVVGGGLLGLAAARALARAGREVTVLEQASAGHRGAGSAGSCRIFRLGYPDPGYVAAARQARGLWHELEADCGTQVLFPVPQLTFGPLMPGVRAAMLAAGAPCELLPAAEAAARFPGIAAGEEVLLEPESCVTAADTALAALAAAVPEVRTGVRVTGLADDGRRVRLDTSDGPLLARVAVVCAGPWTSSLLAGPEAGDRDGARDGDGAGTRAGPSGGLLARVPSAPTLEQVAYLAPAGDGGGAGRAGQAAGTGRQLPIFLCYGRQSPYGLPVPGSPLYKTGIHPSGPPADPDHQDTGADAALAAQMARAARQYLPGLDPRPVTVERCVYDNTPDQDFIVDRVGRVVVGCGTSGHGFKFGLLLGEWLAGLAAGERPELPAALAGGGRFALARFSAGPA
jgi:sarcosine oxidase